jgi:hypothetical protein|tara:strand:- start:907 stop:1569 length:663 start_codon:yes stop_codon:yes gene_type:complete
MKILSFDVGIKNLAYCLLDTEDKSILDWGIINISVDTTCDHVIKGKCCDKTATKIIKDGGFKLCTGHTKLKCYKDKKMKNPPKLENRMLSLGKQIVKKLDEKKNFLNMDVVCIENQPALKNPTMKSVQMIIYSYFLMNGQAKDIQMINARNKLKVYTGPKIECDIKESYKRNKFLAIKYCDYMIRDNSHIDKVYHKLYDDSKKKDDLSDAYLQGIYYIIK